MTPRTNTRKRATRKPVIVLAGEDSNDRECMRIVIEATCPEAHGRLVDINETVRLHQASHPNLTNRVDKLARLAEARAAYERAAIAAVFVHEDYDAVDSDNRATARNRVQQALSARLGSAHYVLATWEVEAWLLLFPQALSATYKTWSVPAKYIGKNTALVQDPKQVLMREIGKANPRYRESDAPKVLAKAAELNLLATPSGTNCSWRELAMHITSLTVSGN